MINILKSLLLKTTSKESVEDGETKACLIQFLWHVCVPWHAKQKSTDQDPALFRHISAPLEDKEFLRQCEVNAYK